ncbi:ribosomal RNA methyltransferase mrm2 [Pyrus ussuriensis x Pyrus communis]|uniref:rRNA methyltransferase 2, mitochondrial n=1 Tax=Pyrus ussuriensis x Pyrus communis TaxID=2448454 RepID=A0A5N5F5I4_9ROSA|nr:ribosomal RNA methyltransferase mrm2 [Pyrus ussuriensis x Pyrus communis]
MSGAGKPDFFYREAQRLGYVARSAFKLLQMQKQYKLITPDSSVLDLGCAPGAWLQVPCQSLGPLKNGGLVVGIDLKKWKIPADHCDSRVQTVCADVMKLPRAQVRELSPQQKACSVVLLDMCPLVSGISSKDAALSLELGMQALNLAESNVGATTSSDDNGVLQRGGNLVIKLLESEDVQEINQICKPLFRKASLLRPKATRSSSREIYLICQGLQSQAKT